MLEPQLEALSEEIGDKLTILKVNVLDFPEISNDFGVMSVPTLIVYKDGEIADQYTGYKTKEMLSTMISPHLE
jgi:thioredoxin 1